MTAGERFKIWLDEIGTYFSEKLGGWVVKSIASGVTKTLEDTEPGAIEAMRETLQLIIDNPKTSPETKRLLESILVKGNIIRVVGGWILALVGTVMGIMGATAPTGIVMSYDTERVVKSLRLDPQSVITAWRRDPEKYKKYFDDLKDLGWSDERIEALKFFTLFMPTAGDIVNWYAKEVYEPDMITKYGLDDELPAYELTDFPKIGVDSTQATNFWRAHWEHASFIQMVEMLHRKLITEDDFREWFRLVEIVPFWRDKLIKIAYTWPTRVDVRRWWDMRTIDEPRLRELYEGMGYRGTNLEDYIKWTKVYVDFPMMMTRFKNGWITENDIRVWLQGLGIPEDRITQFIEEKTKPEKAVRTTKEKDLTKTEIYKGVKKGLISWEQGIELLMDLGYDEDEADYILAVNVGVLEGSPETFEEFRDWTQKWRTATGLEAKPSTEEMKKAAREVVKLTGEIETLERSIIEEKQGLLEEEVLPEATTKRLKSLQVKQNRAESKLSVAKAEYDRLVAEWKHSQL